MLVENNLSQQVAVCRTDYPGTESETVPLDVQAGATSNLTCPSADNYYNWEGAHTSAQYYVNPAGVSVQQALPVGLGGESLGQLRSAQFGGGLQQRRGLAVDFPELTHHRCAFAVYCDYYW